MVTWRSLATCRPCDSLQLTFGPSCPSLDRKRPKKKYSNCRQPQQGLSSNLYCRRTFVIVEASRATGRHAACVFTTSMASCFPVVTINVHALRGGIAHGIWFQANVA